MNESLSVREVSWQLRCSGQHVRDVIRAGELPARRVCPNRGDLRIDRADLEKFITSRIANGQA
jgi:excisionase family DNA binding protein